MIQRVLRFPWGRLTCVLGALLFTLSVGEEPTLPGALMALGFLFAGTALHGLAIWRDKS